MPILADTATSGLTFGLPIGLFFIVLFALLSAYSWYRYATSEGPAYMNDWNISGVLSGIVAVLVVIGLACCMWPYKHDYHYWAPVEGTVQVVRSNFVATDDGTKQNWIVVIRGRPYKIDDARGALVRPGDQLKLECKRQYVWGSSDHGWTCNWKE